MSEKHRKLLVINWQDIRHPLAGGAEIHCHNLFSRLALRGHTVFQLSCRFPGAPAIENIDGVQIHRSGNRNLFNYSVPILAQRLCRKHRIDLVIEDLNKIPFFTPLYINLPILVLAHHLFGPAIYHAVGALYGSYVLAAEKLIPLVYRKTPFAAVSGSTRTELTKLGLKTMGLLSNGNSVPDSTILAEPETPPIIGYFGRVEKYKRIDHLLTVLPEIRRAVPGTRLFIIGDGFHRKWLEKQVLHRGIDHCVTFTGWISESEKWKMLSRLSLGICPSPKEGWGLSVMELAACGVPVIAADVPGLRETVCHEKTGRLYPFGNTARLTDHIVELLKASAIRTRMGIAARRWASGRSWEHTADHAEAIFSQILQKSRTKPL